MNFTKEEIEIIREALTIVNIRLDGEVPPPVKGFEPSEILRDEIPIETFTFVSHQRKCELFIDVVRNKIGLTPTHIEENRYDPMNGPSASVFYERLTRTQQKTLENISKTL